MAIKRQLIMTSVMIGLLSVTQLPLAAFGATSTTTTMANNNTEPRTTQFWWPNQLSLNPLRQHAKESNPLGKDFNYAKAFNSLDLNAVKKDINALLTTSQDWWPSDFDNYGPFFIRMAWHSAGTYRMNDGRGGADGGQQRFEPLNSWPDNANLDKARRLLLPIKEKYGQKISWADLMVLTGNVALENMGFKTFGFAGGRTDDWEPDLVYWGPETKFLANERHNPDGKLQNPLAAVQMGLIYVNPEGPNGNPDLAGAAKDTREAFGRMAMNDEETVALIAGGHTFGKSHGAVPATCLEPEPAAAGIEEQGLGWKNKCGTGKGDDALTSGLEGSWSHKPTQWSNLYLDNLFKFDWVKTKSPAGAIQWTPREKSASKLAPDAQNPNIKHAPMMFTTDLALKFDPSYRKIAERFWKHPKDFELAFAKAWFKLTHRDMGPAGRYLGPEVPKEQLIWQDPVPAANYPLISNEDAKQLKTIIIHSDLTVPELVRVAWASAASFRGTDMRGGANGARIRLVPQKDWPVNNPQELATVLSKLEKIQTDFNAHLTSGKKISFADTIVLAGNAAIEKAAADAGYTNVEVPFKPGRTDASQSQTDVQAFAVLEPKADGFRNYFAGDNQKSPTEMLVDKASTLNLTVPEMTVLLGGMRTLNANYQQSDLGVLTTKPGTLSNDFFVNLLDMSTVWKKSSASEEQYEGVDRKTGAHKWSATPVDLIFGSNSELRAVSEVYAAADAKQKFVTDFVKAWTKVMNLDRYENGQKL